MSKGLAAYRGLEKRRALKHGYDENSVAGKATGCPTGQPAYRFAIGHRDVSQRHHSIAKLMAYFIFPLTAIFSCLPARNAGAIDALI